MLTTTDINKLKEVFATKEDLKSLVTKDDAKKFTIKDDLKLLTTKKDVEHGFRELVEFIGDVRQELKGDIQNLRSETLHEISGLRVDIKIATSYKEILVNHETRITALEKA